MRPAPAMLLIAPLALASCQTSGPGDFDGTAPRYAVLPFRDFAHAPAMTGRVLEGLARELERRGAQGVPPDALEGILRERRIRHTESVSAEQARAIGAATGANHLLLGAVLDAAPGPDPRLCVALRVLDPRDLSLLSAQIVALRGADFEGLLGLGAIEDPIELADEVLARLLERFDPRGHPRPPRRPTERGPLDGPPPPTPTAVRYVEPSFDAQHPGRIVLFPLENRSQQTGAGAVFAGVLANEWSSRPGAIVVEASEVRAVMIREGLRSIESVDFEFLRRLGKKVGARYLVTGSVEAFRDDA